MPAKYYFCGMIKKFFLVFISLIPFFITGRAQTFANTEDLLRRPGENPQAGRLHIIQNPSIDTLLYRYKLGNLELSNKNNGHFGMDRFRIQIYSSSNRNAREESGKAMARFISKFPDINSYSLFADPGYFKIRVGNFRTKAEAVKIFLMVSREFPDAYIVPDFIDFPDLNIK
jgi:hypothetical protein